MADLLKRYKAGGEITEVDAQMELLRRTDEIPVALVLAQAANESGWGTSRFAREGNSLFGQWTFRKSTSGLVPDSRSQDAAHRVRSFESIRASVRAYLRNLNVGHAYVELRKLRAAMRKRGEPLDPLILATGLKRYSQRGEAYVEEIKALILSNRLQYLVLGQTGS